MEISNPRPAYAGLFFLTKPVNLCLYLPDELHLIPALYPEIHLFSPACLWHLKCIFAMFLNILMTFWSEWHIIQPPSRATRSRRAKQRRCLFSPRCVLWQKVNERIAAFYYMFKIIVFLDTFYQYVYAVNI